MAVLSNSKTTFVTVNRIVVLVFCSPFPIQKQPLLLLIRWYSMRYIVDYIIQKQPLLLLISN